jgi:hypothetical protein
MVGEMEGKPRKPLKATEVQEDELRKSRIMGLGR